MIKILYCTSYIVASSANFRLKDYNFGRNQTIPLQLHVTCIHFRYNQSLIIIFQK